MATGVDVDVSNDGMMCIIVVDMGDGSQDDIEIETRLIDTLISKLKEANRMAYEITRKDA